MKKIVLIMIVVLFSLSLFACSNNDNSGNTIDPNGNTLDENVLYEDIIFEDEEIENQIYEIYLQEKTIVENVTREALLEEDIIEEVFLLETFYIPVDDPYKYYDGAAGMALFGDNLNIDSLIQKGAIGAGCILTIAVVSVAPFTSPISVAVITVAKNALPYAIKGATVGTIMGAGIGATLGFTDAIDSSERITALTTLGLSTAFLIASIINPPLAGTAFAVWGAVTAITASSAGLIYSGVNAYNAFTRTDQIDLELSNLDWDVMGYTIAERAIGGAADGFVIGAISGAVIGAAQSFRYVNGKMVLVDNSIFDPAYVDPLGRTNIERMEAGLAPIGHDGYSVEIHHLDQSDTGAVVEMMSTVHKSNYYEIHSNTGQYPSAIDRPAFNTWRNLYWKWRSTTFS